MLFKQIIMIVTCVFFILGVVDKMTGYRLGLGQAFDEAFDSAGRVILSVVGIICLSPVLAYLLQPAIVPVFSVFGIDPAMFPSLFLSPDVGGYNIAMEMALDPRIGAWSGTVVAAHMGAFVAFTIPVSLNIIPKPYHRNFSIGALSGLIASPLGCIAGGLMMGLQIFEILHNMVPLLLLSVLIVLGLIFAPDLNIKLFNLFGKALIVVVMIGFVLATIERLTGFAPLQAAVPSAPALKPFSEAITIGGTVLLTMGGVMVFTQVILRFGKKPLRVISRTLGINEMAIMGILNGTASTLPGSVSYHKMNPRGQVFFAAFLLSAANILGAHLGYVGVYLPELLAPVFAGKILSGCFALPLSLLVAARLKPDAVPEAEPAGASEKEE